VKSVTEQYRLHYLKNLILPSIGILKGKMNVSHASLRQIVISVDFPSIG